MRASRTAVCGGLGRERFTEIVIGSSRDAVFVVDLLMSVGMDLLQMVSKQS
jgi:hypothetical protein